MREKRFWSYENQMVAICMLCFGFVMFDRFTIATLATFIMPDLQLSDAELGFAMSAFALSWGIAGLVGSMLSDMIASKKRILVICVIAFSVCSLLTGMAAGFIMLIIIRFVIGAFSGPVFPIAQSFVLAQSSPHRRGRNMGLVGTTSMGLISMLAGPLILVALAQALGWRPTFYLTLIPGLIIAFLIFKILKEPDMTKVAGVKSKAEKPTLKESLIAFRNRNVVTAILFSSFILCWNVSTLTFAPVYLVTKKGFSATDMSYIMAVIGLGAVVWGVVVPSLSDRFGRKPVIIIFTLLTLVSSAGLIMATSPILIGVCVFAGWGGSGVIPLYQATVIGESVDGKYASTVMSAVQMTGEIGGCVIGVAVAGLLAGAYGLQVALIFAACCLVVAAVIAFGFYETAPRVLERRKAVK